MEIRANKVLVEYTCPTKNEKVSVDIKKINANLSAYATHENFSWNDVNIAKAYFKCPLCDKCHGIELFKVYKRYGNGLPLKIKFSKPYLFFYRIYWRIKLRKSI